MFGYLLVSNKNNVVLVDGDGNFKSYLWKRIDTEIHAPMEVASTSSGVFTDSAESLPPQKPPRKTSAQFSMREVSHLFLPLISLYRGAGASNVDSLSMAVSQDCRIRFKQLANNFLLLCVGNCERKQQEFLEYFQCGLDINLGPLLDLVDTDLLPVKNGRENVQLLLARHCRGHVRKSKDHLDVLRSSYYKTQIEKVFPLLKSVCSQLHLFIGSNRCLLMSGGDVLASVNSTSDDRQLWRQLSLRDLHCLLDQLETLPAAPMRGEISQMWMRSSVGLVPYYVNVIRCRLTDQLVLVCLSEAKHVKLIRLVALMLMQLEQIQTTDDVAKDVDEITKTVEDVTKNLMDMLNTSKNPHQTPPETAFLRNPTYSSQFFKSVWGRLSSELLRTCQEGPPTTSSKARSKFSLGSLKSVFSQISLTTSIYSMKNHNGRVSKEIPLKLDVLLSYWRRQVTTLLQELCGLAQREALQYKLALFQDSMSRIFRPTHEKMMYSLGIGSPEKEQNLKDYLRPIDRRLDMLAFVYCNNDTKLNLSYIPEEIRGEMDSLRPTLNSFNFCADIRGKSGEMYTVYHVQTDSAKRNLPQSVDSLLRNWWKPQENTGIPPGITLTVVFNSFVHKQLALNQIAILSRSVHKIVTNSSRLYL